MGATGENAGDRIDRYQLVREIGEGGMGTVWLARQSEPVTREVALKIIKLGMDTREVVVRFEAERQALALMDHPHIAKVLDGGATAGGRPYFVMELVEGKPITDHCDGTRLALRARLELFCRVCEGVQHAHHKGLIHRDLKPGNVLVSLQDGLAVPKVIDFGIAKATGGELTQHTMATELGQMLGTPEYMAPEQLGLSGLDIDTRADVYSLGVLLYELLTGTKPFDLHRVIETGYDELLRTIREVDPEKPSTRITKLEGSATSIAALRRVEARTLREGLAGDLDWIVMKALEKDRSRRYESASAFAADVARFLAHEPVLAAPPSTRYRLRKFVRRRRKTVVALATILFLFVAGSIGTGVGLLETVRANRALDLALAEKGQALTEEARQRRRAEESAERAREAEDEARREAERAQAAEARSLARSAELEQVATFQAAQLSDVAPEVVGIGLRRALMEAVPEERRDALGASLAGINFTTQAQGMLEASLFARTLEAIESQFTEQPLVRARLLQSMASTLLDLGLIDTAAEPQRSALAIRRSELGRDHPDTLTSLREMGRQLKSKGKLVEAERVYREALEGDRRVLGADDPETLRVTNNLALLLQRQGRLEEAEPLLRDGFERCRRVLGKEEPLTLTLLHNLALLLQSDGRLAEAETLLREALEGARRAHGDHHTSTLASVANMGALLLELGRAEEAEPFFREALEGYSSVLGEDHPTTLEAIVMMGVQRHMRGQTAEAVDLLAGALEDMRESLGDVHPKTLIAIQNLGDLLYFQGELDAAWEFYLEALDGNRWNLTDDHADVLFLLGLVADLSLERIASARGLGDPVAECTLLALHGALQLDFGRYAAAEATLAEASQLCFEALPDSDPRVWCALSELGASVAGQGRFAEAEPLLLESAEWVLANDGAGWRLDGSSSGMASRTPQAIVERVIEFYGAWHVEQPDQGHDARAVEWRERWGGRERSRSD